MDNKKVYDNFRKQLTGVHAITVSIVSLLEIIGYGILVLLKKANFSFSDLYLWRAVVLPIVANAGIHWWARTLVQKKTLSRKKKNQVIIAASLATALVVALCHREYSVTGCAFVFPMILSAIFNDKKLLDATFGASILILMTVAASFLIFGGGNYICFFSLFILVGFAAVSYFCGRISINFSNSNYLTIKQQAAENDRLQEDVLRDQMTGLYDHTAFMDQLEALVETEGNGRPFCLVMMDLDDFKTINDRFGHDSGDDVLIFMGKTLLKHCGKSDTAYRYGGEEFALILRDRGLDDSYEFVLQVLAEMVVHRFEFTNSPVTFSAGIARYQEGDTMDSLFERADQTLYRAKNDGKKRIYKAK